MDPIHEKSDRGAALRETVPAISCMARMVSSSVLVP